MTNFVTSLRKSCNPQTFLKYGLGIHLKLSQVTSKYLLRLRRYHTTRKGRQLYDANRSWVLTLLPRGQISPGQFFCNPYSPEPPMSRIVVKFSAFSQPFIGNIVKMLSFYFPERRLQYQFSDALSPNFEFFDICRWPLPLEPVLCQISHGKLSVMPA